VHRGGGAQFGKKREREDWWRLTLVKYSSPNTASPRFVFICIFGCTHREVSVVLCNSVLCWHVFGANSTWVPIFLSFFKSSPFTKVHSLYSIIIDVKNVEILSIVFFVNKHTIFFIISGKVS
jgi:hypothetical protein